MEREWHTNFTTNTRIPIGIKCHVANRSRFACTMVKQKSVVAFWWLL